VIVDLYATLNLKEKTLQSNYRRFMKF
jgi:hypothetical protein